LRDLSDRAHDAENRIILPPLHTKKFFPNDGKIVQGPPRIAHSAGLSRNIDDAIMSGSTRRKKDPAEFKRFPSNKVGRPIRGKKALNGLLRRRNGSPELRESYSRVALAVGW
jgi:hypothetical protein